MESFLSQYTYSVVNIVGFCFEAEEFFTFERDK